MGTLFEHRRALVGMLLAAASLLFVIYSREAVTLAASLVLITVLLTAPPFALGFLAQALLRDRVLRDYVVLICSAVLMLPWWLWGIGFSVEVAGPRAISLVISIAYLTWFGTLGSAYARRVRARRSAEGPTPAPEA